MNSSLSQSTLTTVAALMRTVWGGVVLGFGVLRGEMDFDLAVQTWVDGIFRGLEALLAAFRAHALRPVVTPVARGEAPSAVPVEAGLSRHAAAATSLRAKRAPRDSERGDESCVDMQHDCHARMDCRVASWLLAVTRDESFDLPDRLRLHAGFGPVFYKTGLAGA
jgi:hypothetical protein